MKKILASLVITSFFTLFASSVFAGKTSGCGPGAFMLKGNRGLISNLSAYTTNNTSGFVTFSMTSGTSGCNPNDTVMNNMDNEIFVRDNFKMIQSELSQGSGEFVSTYVSMLQCSDDKKALAKMQENPSLIDFASYREFVIASKNLLSETCTG